MAVLPGEAEAQHAAAVSAEAPLARLLAITHDILGADGLIAGLESIARGVQDLFAFKYVTIVAAEDGGSELRRLVMLGWPDATIRGRLNERIGRRLILEILKPEFEVFESCFFIPAESEAQWSQSIYTGDQSADAPRGASDRWHERDSLVLQLRERCGAMLGYMSVDGPRDGKIPSRDTLRSMQLFVNLVGLALANARAHASEVERRTLLEASHAQLRHQATHDGLTGLANRALLATNLDETLSEARSNRSRLYAALFIDLDGFKAINDTRGHLVGDNVLITVARRLAEVAGSKDFVARLGGDEFAVIMRDRVDLEEALRDVRLFLSEVVRPIDIGGALVSTSASIGVAPIMPEYQSFTEILRDADTAMYAAKNNGRSEYSVFVPAMDLHPSREARTPRSHALD